MPNNTSSNTPDDATRIAGLDAAFDSAVSADETHAEFIPDKDSILAEMLAELKALGPDGVKAKYGIK